MDKSKFVQTFNDNFGAPYLPDKFASAEILPSGSIIIQIGPRDLQLDETGESLGAGTCLESRWVIRKEE